MYRINLHFHDIARCSIWVHICMDITYIIDGIAQSIFPNYSLEPGNGMLGFWVIYTFFPYSLVFGSICCSLDLLMCITSSPTTGSVSNATVM